MDRVKRALHYPFYWIRFLEINKSCNVAINKKFDIFNKSKVDFN